MIRKLVHGGEQVIDGLAIREDFGGAGGGAGRRGDRYLLIALAFGLETEIFVLSLGVIPKRAHREISAAMSVALNFSKLWRILLATRTSASNGSRSEWNATPGMRFLANSRHTAFSSLVRYAGASQAGHPS